MATKSPVLTYSISIDAPQTHYAKVRIQIENNNLKLIHFKMPVWTPGSYMVREFERNIEQVAAQSTGKTLNISKVDKSTWAIDGKNTGKTIHHNLLNG